MAQQLEHIEYLSREIGPRPAGTEEEQQAALYIVEEFRNEAGFPAVIEDITSASNIESPRAICSIITVVVALIAMIYQPFTLAAVVIALLSGGVYVAESIGYPVITKLLAKGASQNVVAKYEPGAGSGARTRKVVLVAHYDTGKVKPKAVSMLESLPIPWSMVCFGAMIFIPVFMLLRFLFFADPQGAGAVIVNLITFIAVLLAAIPAIKAVLYRVAPFSEGANDNASGVATMMAIAKDISEGLMNEDEINAMENETVVHDEFAAEEAGLVPDGAEVVYHAKPTVSNIPADDAAPADRLSAAKAAIAALTGESVSMENFIDEFPEDAESVGSVQINDISSNPAVEDEGAYADYAESDLSGLSAAEAAETFMAEPQPVVVSPEPESVQNDVPDWFAAAQKKAKHSSEKVKPAQRSRYADALDAAVSASSVFFNEANRIVQTEGEERMKARSADIVEVAPPAPNDPRPRAERPAIIPITTAPGSEPRVVMEPVAVEADTELAPVAELGEADTQAAYESDQASDVLAESSDIQVADPVQDNSVAEAIEEDRMQNAASGQSMESMGYETIENAFAEKNIPMPSFLNPHIAQEKAVAERDDSDRTANRVDVTTVPMEEDGRAAVVSDAGINGTTRMAPIQLSPEELKAAGANRDAVVAMSQRIGEVSERIPSEKPAQEQVEAQAETMTQPSAQTAEHVRVGDNEADFEVTHQRAPISVATVQSATSNRLSALPSINPTNPTVSDQDSPSKSGMMRALRTKLPSMSGSFERVEDPNAVAVSSVSTVGSFGAAGATGSFEPVGDELLENVDPEDVYVDDADDSDIEDGYTESGAYAGPGYVDMPKSRVRRFFDKFSFGKGSSQDESTPQEWLDVEDEFDPRAVGKERGGWESFRDEEIIDRRNDGAGRAEYVNDDYVGDGYAEGAYADDAYADDFYDDEPKPRRSANGRSRRKWQGGALSRVRLGRVDTTSSEEAASASAAAALDEDVETPEEIKQIYQFRNPNFNTEVWFVALGSEVDHHDGIRSFIAAHESELRGAVIIDLEAIGAGDLTLVQNEGAIKKEKTSSRMKRYTSKASRETGISISEINGLNMDTAASISIANGLQAMHIIGAENGAKALTSADEDVIENIDEQKLEENTYFVEEMIKII